MMENPNQNGANFSLPKADNSELAPPLCNRTSPIFNRHAIQSVDLDHQTGEIHYNRRRSEQRSLLAEVRGKAYRLWSLARIDDADAAQNAQPVISRAAIIGDNLAYDAVIPMMIDTMEEWRKEGFTRSQPLPALEGPR